MRAARVLPVVLALCAGLTACGDDDPPPVTLPPITQPPSATATPTPTPSADAVPSEATQQTPDGAAEFVRFFYEQIELGYATRDPDLVGALSEPDCVSCQNFIGSLTDLRDKNERVSGYGVEVVSAVAPGFEPDAMKVGVGAELNIDEYIRYNAQGEVVTREAPLVGLVQTVDLVRTDEGWSVAAITTENAG